MFPQKILSAFRLITGGGISLGIYTHQVDAVHAVFGYNVLSVSYLFAVLVFYGYLFLARFCQHAGFESNFQPEMAKQAHNIERSLIVANVILTMYELYLNGHLASVDLATGVHSIGSGFLLYVQGKVYGFFKKLFAQN